jgi:hypothetical protein
MPSDGLPSLARRLSGQRDGAVGTGLARLGAAAKLVVGGRPGRTERRERAEPDAEEADDGEYRREGDAMPATSG